MPQPPARNARSRDISEEEKRLKAWKYYGYPELTKWMASSNDFLIIRRFSQLGIRAMLLLQDDLVQIEEKMQRMDQYIMNMPPGFDGSGSFRRDVNSPRDKLLREAVPILKNYYEYVDAFSRVKSKPGAENHQIRSVQNWFHNKHDAIHKEERTFIEREGDIIAVVSRTKSLLRMLLERVQSIRHLFRLRHRADRVDSESTLYFSDRWLDTFTTATIILVGLIMLFVPMWWLNSMSDSYKRLGVITGFVVLFSLLLFGATTNATRGFEVLAATAAYAAVLAVFLQGGGSMQTQDYFFMNGSI